MMEKIIVPITVKISHNFFFLMSKKMPVKNKEGIDNRAVVRWPTIDNSKGKIKKEERRSIK